MAPFIVLTLSFLLFRALGFFGLPSLDDWETCLRLAVASMLLLTASAHWGRRRPDLIRMVPPAFPQPGLIVTLTGWLELIGAAGIIWPPTSYIASIGLAVLLIAMFPANIRAAREKLTIAGQPVPSMIPRTLLQLVFITAVLLAGQS